MTNAVTTQFSEEDVAVFLQQHYQLTGTLKSLPGYCDQNLTLTSDSGEQYIVKVANSGESKLELDMQNAAMVHLTELAIAVPHAIANHNDQLITVIENANQDKFYLRVLTYLPGVFYADANSTTHGAELWTSLGQFVGQIDKALANFNHQGANRYLDWDLAQGLSICQTKKHCLADEQRELVDYFLNLYQTQTLPVLSQLPQGVIHNDANDYNVLIDEVKQPKNITGLIDFGDLVHSHVVNELAIASAYALMGQQQPLTALKTVVAGYHQVRSLKDVELEVLFSLVALRLCTTVCNSTLAYQQQPENDYLLVSVKPAWALLKQLRNLNPFAVYCQLKQACQLPADSGKSKA